MIHDMTNIRSSIRNVFNMLNPYHEHGGMRAFITDARKEGLIKPVFYGLAVGAGVFDISSEIGKNFIRKPFRKFIEKPLKRIMGLEKPKTLSFKERSFGSDSVTRSHFWCEFWCWCCCGNSGCLWLA